MVNVTDFVEVRNFVQAFLEDLVLELGSGYLWFEVRGLWVLLVKICEYYLKMFRILLNMT